LTAFDRLDTSTTEVWKRARLEAHYAAQLLAAAGETLLPADSHFHFSSAVFDPETQALVGAILPSGAHLRLEIPTLTLEVHGADGSTAAHSLIGGTMAAGAAWLEEQLGATLQFPSWELPAGEVRDFGTFRADPAGHAQIAGWYDAAHRTFEAFQPPEGERSDTRVWPHHFDIAVLVTLQDDPNDPEASRTTGMGMTPGDGGIAEPYLYVTPWPYPATWTTPALPAGRWNTEGWYGAVLAGEEVVDQATVDAFIGAAYAHCAAVAGN